MSMRTSLLLYLLLLCLPLLAFASDKGSSSSGAGTGQQTSPPAAQGQQGSAGGQSWQIQMGADPGSQSWQEPPGEKHSGETAQPQQGTDAPQTALPQQPPDHTTQSGQPQQDPDDAAKAGKSPQSKKDSGQSKQAHSPDQDTPDQDTADQDTADQGTADQDNADQSGQAASSKVKNEGESPYPGLATPSPYDDADHDFDKPFALSRTRTFKPQRGALKTVPRDAASPTDITVEVDACDQLAGDKAKHLDHFKQQLLDQAREKAAYDLFTRMYAGQSQVGIQEQLPPNYKHSLAEKLQVQGTPKYYNGKTFGELCVSIKASLPPQHMQTAAPLVATLQNFCYRDPSLPEYELKAEAQSAALDRIIQNIAPGADVPPQTRNQFLRDARISGQLGGQHDDVYCLDMQLEVAPLELTPHVPGTEKKQAAPGPAETLAETTRATWSLDLSQYSPGQPVPQFGKNLVVYKDANGKSLGPNSRDGAMAVLPVSSSENFSLRVLVARGMSYDFLYDKTYEFFRVHFDNKTWEQAAFVMSMDDDNNPMAYFQSRLQSSETFPWDMAVNFNDCLLIKQQGRIRFFFNGRFILNYPTSGGSLTQVRVPLQWDDRLYNVLIKNLDGK